MNKKIVFFDYDGVIVNTFDTAFEIANDIDHSIKKEEYREWFEKNAHKFIAEKEESNKKKFVKEFFNRFNKKLKQKGANEKVAEQIEKLAEDYILMIVSSTGSRIITEQLQKYGLDEHFYEILGYDVHTSKSKKISDILKVYKTEEKDSVLITDTLGDIREANHVDVKSIGVTWGYHNKETLQKGSPAKIISSPKNINTSVKKVLEKTNAPKPIGDKKVVYEGKVFTIKEQKVEYEDGKKDIFEFCQRPASVNTLAFNGSEQLLLIKEDRVGHEGEVWFLPTGKVKEEETPKHAAQQELREESDYKAKNIELFRKNSPSSTLQWDVYTFIATDLKKDPLEGDKGEQISETKFVDLDEAVEMALNEKIPNEFLSYNIIKYNHLKQRDEI